MRPTRQPMKRIIAVVVVATNILIAVMTAALVGPAASKLQDLFGLVPWAGRIPFYLLPLFLGPLILWTRPTSHTAATLGFFLSLPLVSWSVATRCPPAVWLAYIASGTLQGYVLAWIARCADEPTDVPLT